MSSGSDVEQQPCAASPSRPRRLRAAAIERAGERVRHAPTATTASSGSDVKRAGGERVRHAPTATTVSSGSESSGSDVERAGGRVRHAPTATTASSGSDVERQ